MRSPPTVRGLPGRRLRTRSAEVAEAPPAGDGDKARQSDPQRVSSTQMCTLWSFELQIFEQAKNCSEADATVTVTPFGCGPTGAKLVPELNVQLSYEARSGSSQR